MLILGEIADIMANEEEAAAKKMIRSVLLTAKDGMTAKELQGRAIVETVKGEANQIG